MKFGRVGWGAGFALFWGFSSIAYSADAPITAIAFAPDGKSVVVGSQAGLAIRRWPELKSQKTFETELVNIHDVAFSSDGELLAVAGGTPGEAGVVDVIAWPSGERISVLRGHQDCVMSTVWTGKDSLATAGLDGEIVLWNVETQQQLQRFAGHSRGVAALVYVARERLLVSGSLDQSLRVWDVKSGRLVRTLNHHTQAVHQLALRPSNGGLPMIASVGADRTVRLWQPTIGRMVRFARPDSIPLAAAWLPDRDGDENGSRVAVASIDGRIRVFDPETVAIIRDVPAIDGWAYSLAAHPTDGHLLVGGRRGQLRRITLEIPATAVSP